jgi:hypothetical protein
LPVIRKLSNWGSANWLLRARDLATWLLGVLGLLELLKRTGERRLRSGSRLEYVRDPQGDGSGECLDTVALLTR